MSLRILDSVHEEGVKNFIFVVIPILCALAVGAYSGYGTYLEELRYGSDFEDSIRWAIVAGVFISPVGLLAGLILDLVMWAVIPKREKRESENISKKFRKIPNFESEDAERKFWSKEDSTDYVDWHQADFTALPNLKRDN